MGSDADTCRLLSVLGIFQSTLPGWGATRRWFAAPRMGSDPAMVRRFPAGRYFNPRSPDGERRFGIHFVFPSICISIHAPRMGSDALIGTMIIMMWYFNPRSPDGERRGVAPGGAHMFRISIHAPRMGSDRPRRCRWEHPGYFNPRSPDGERQVFDRADLIQSLFQSTLPGWGATQDTSTSTDWTLISIHAPRMGSDR